MARSTSMIRTAYCVKRTSHYATRITQYLLLVSLLFVAACQANNDSTHHHRFSGVLEGMKVNVVAEVGGRILDITVEEGDPVTLGQPLVTLDDAALHAQVKQAQAALSAAEANLAQVKAGTRREAIAAAEAAWQQAQAERVGAALTLSNTLMIRKNPQQITAQVDAARSGVPLAEQNVAVAETRLAEARYWRDFYENDKGKHETLDRQIGIAQKNLEAAQAQLSGAQAQLNALQAMRSQPVLLQAQVNQARHAYSLTVASEAVAAANVIELKAGPTPEEVALAEAKVQQARAALNLARAAQSRAQIAAPLTGMVAQRSGHVGETVQPGSTLLALVNVDTLDMIIYVPQAQLPRVQIGMPVKVYVDTYPNETFKAEVVNIALQAQFSSRDTQNKEDRANIVFAVKVRLLNADGRLKSGMTADAELQLQ
ncbi:putative multidrug resistance protein EmrK [Thermoflexales bacterium]|nr:putative multidrug resistance protein EmrK [Thermoflexales bacterium]